MLYPWLTPLLAAIACLFLAAIVIVRGPKNELGRVFTLAGMVLASFNLFYFVLYFVDDYESALYWARVFRVGTFLTTPVGVHLSLALRPNRSRAWTGILVATYSLATAFIVGNLFDLFVDGLVPIPWGYTTHRTNLYEILTVYTLINAIAAISLIILNYYTATDPRTRLQSKFWMLGITAGISLGLTNFLPSYGVPVYPLGHFGSVAFAAILAYAIVRHRLMGVEVAVTKGIAYAVVAAVVVFPAFAIGVSMQRVAFGTASYEFSVGLLALLIATGVMFPVTKRWIESKLERSLFRETREGRAALASFAKSTVRIIDEDELVSQLCDTVLRVFGLDRIALFLMTDSRRAYRVRGSRGAEPVVKSFDRTHPLCGWLQSRGECVLLSEAQSHLAGGDRTAVVDSLERAEWSACVPLLASNQGLVGFLALGRKANLDGFVQEDLEALEVLAAEASIAFDNARLYEEVRRSHDIINRSARLSALGTFAAGIAHEVRNPLVSIQTFFQLAPQRLDDEEFMTSFLPLAEQELVRIRSLITELLSFAKSPNAAVQPVSVSDVVERSLTLLRPHARKEKVELSVDSDTANVVVEADPEQLMQVMVNIVLNAIQASPENSQVNVEVRRVETQTGDVVRVRITDSGDGVPDDQREAIFNPFYTTKDKGTGLGLSIVHRIVVDSGGSISVEDGPGGSGACFVIQLPATDEDVEVPDWEHLQPDRPMA